MGWAFASPDGKPGRETARDLLSQLCEYTLHLDAFEQKLDKISTAERPQTAVKSTWEHRDLPVLAAVICLLDETATAQVRVSEVAEACGLGIGEVASAVEALNGTYLTRQKTLGDAGSWVISRPADAARRAVSQWLPDDPAV
jgi:hypothetical protein